jgi:carbon storage regulator CsrA
MLVLLRKVGEEIVIGRQVIVRVARVSRNRAFLAIEAPENVRVDRKEIRLAKNRERRAAACCESERMQARAEETRQGQSDSESGSNPALVGSSYVRRAIPMLNRVSGKEKREEDLAKRDDHRRVLQRGIPPGAKPNATGLRAAVSRLIADSQACDGPDIEFCDDLAIAELRPELQSAVCCIVEELLLNACRHSKSKNVLLGLAQDDERVCIQVQDWGIGFDPEMVQPHTLGLQGIRQLARRLGGTVDIDSRPGAGTCIVVEVPLLQETEPSAPTCESKPR